MFEFLCFVFIIRSAINFLETEKALQNGAPMWQMSWVRSSSVLTSEESVDKMRSMAEGLMQRYRRDGEAPPELIHVYRPWLLSCLWLGTALQWVDRWGYAGTARCLSLDPSIWCGRSDGSPPKVSPVQVCPLCCSLCLSGALQPVFCAEGQARWFQQ